MINLSTPLNGKWEGRGFGRHFVWTYECPLCKRQVRVRASAFRGKNPEPGVGGIRCDCEQVKEE